MYRLFNKITALFKEINEELNCTGMKLCINTEYAPEYLKEVADTYKDVWKLNETEFIHGRGHHKSQQQRHYEKLLEYTQKLEEYVEKIQICGENRNSYSKSDHSATFGIMKNDRWYKRIVRRGIESVRLEMFLVSIGQNLYKFHNKKKRTLVAA